MAAINSVLQRIRAHANKVRGARPHVQRVPLGPDMTSVQSAYITAFNTDTVTVGRYTRGCMFSALFKMGGDAFVMPNMHIGIATLELVRDRDGRTVDPARVPHSVALDEGGRVWKVFHVLCAIPHPCPVAAYVSTITFAPAKSIIPKLSKRIRAPAGAPLFVQIARESSHPVRVAPAALVVGGDAYTQIAAACGIPETAESPDAPGTVLAGAAFIDHFARRIGAAMGGEYATVPAMDDDGWLGAVTARVDAVRLRNGHVLEYTPTNYPVFIPHRGAEWNPDPDGDSPATIDRYVERATEKGMWVAAREPGGAYVRLTHAPSSSIIFQLEIVMAQFMRGVIVKTGLEKNGSTLDSINEFFDAQGTPVGSWKLGVLAPHPALLATSAQTIAFMYLVLFAPLRAGRVCKAAAPESLMYRLWDTFVSRLEKSDKPHRYVEWAYLFEPNMRTALAKHDSFFRGDASAEAGIVGASGAYETGKVRFADGQFWDPKHPRFSAEKPRRLPVRKALTFNDLITGKRPRSGGDDARPAKRQKPAVPRDKEYIDWRVPMPSGDDPDFMKVNRVAALITLVVGRLSGTSGSTGSVCNGMQFAPPHSLSLPPPVAMKGVLVLHGVSPVAHSALGIFASNVGTVFPVPPSWEGDVTLVTPDELRGAFPSAVNKNTRDVELDAIFERDEAIWFGQLAALCSMGSVDHQIPCVDERMLRRALRLCIHRGSVIAVRTTPEFATEYCETRPYSWDSNGTWRTMPVLIFGVRKYAQFNRILADLRANCGPVRTEAIDRAECQRDARKRIFTRLAREERRSKARKRSAPPEPLEFDATGRPAKPADIGVGVWREIVALAEDELARLMEEREERIYAPIREIGKTLKRTADLTLPDAISQADAFEAIVFSGGHWHLIGPGGTGKTYTAQCVIRALQKLGDASVATSYTNVVVALCRRRFKIPATTITRIINNAPACADLPSARAVFSEEESQLSTAMRAKLSRAVVPGLGPRVTIKGIRTFVRMGDEKQTPPVSDKGEFEERQRALKAVARSRGSGALARVCRLTENCRANNRMLTRVQAAVAKDSLRGFVLAFEHTTPVPVADRGHPFHEFFLDAYITEGSDGKIQSPLRVIENPNGSKYDVGPIVQAIIERCGTMGLLIIGPRWQVASTETDTHFPECHIFAVAANMVIEHIERKRHAAATGRPAPPPIDWANTELDTRVSGYQPVSGHLVRVTRDFQEEREAGPQEQFTRNKNSVFLCLGWAAGDESRLFPTFDYAARACAKRRNLNPERDVRIVLLNRTEAVVDHFDDLDADASTPTFTQITARGADGVPRDLSTALFVMNGDEWERVSEGERSDGRRVFFWRGFEAVSVTWVAGRVERGATISIHGAQGMGLPHVVMAQVGATRAMTRRVFNTAVGRASEEVILVYFGSALGIVHSLIDSRFEYAVSGLAALATFPPPHVRADWERIDATIALANTEIAVRRGGALTRASKQARLADLREIERTRMQAADNATGYSAGCTFRTLGLPEYEEAARVAFATAPRVSLAEHYAADIPDDVFTAFIADMDADEGAAAMDVDEGVAALERQFSADTFAAAMDFDGGPA